MGELKDRKLKSLDDLFSDTATDSDIKNSEDVVELPIYRCIPYHNHKFRTKRGNYEEFVKSIQEFGVLTPILVRPYEDDYEIIAGHNRRQGAMDAGRETIPAIIRDLNDNEAWLIVSETNIHQSSLGDMLHSERAEVLHDYHEALKSQGKRNDILDEVKKLLEDTENEESETSRHSGEKLDSCSEAGKEFKLSPRTVSRYLRIYYLDSELKVMLDENKIAFLAAVELSYLSDINQSFLSDILNNDSYKLGIDKAKELRKMERNHILDEESMKNLLDGTLKNKEKKKSSILKGIKIKPTIMKKYFHKEQTPEEVEDIIDKALELYHRSLE